MCLATRFLSVAAVTAVTAPAAAYARVEHDGLYVRGQLGVGGAVASSEIEFTNTDITFRGGGGWLNLEVGGAVMPGTIVFGKAYWLTVPDPSLEVGDTTFDTDITGRFYGLGAGVTHYFSPSNFYLSGALTLSKLGSEVRGAEDYASDVGIMVHVGAGIELFATSELGLGVGAELAYGGFPDDDLDDNGFVWGGGYGVIAFSATYN